MSPFVRLAILALAAMLWTVSAEAKGPPVMIQIEYHFTTPSGGSKVWTSQIQYPSAEHAEKDCVSNVNKDGRKIAKGMVVNYRALVGHTFVSANCVMANGAVKTSNRAYGPYELPDAAAVAMYYVDAKGASHPALFYNPQGSMSMDQCLKQLRALTPKFKKNIKDNIRDFDGMKFVKSECAFVEGFEL
jgi:hypothetical protein